MCAINQHVSAVVTRLPYVLCWLPYLDVLSTIVVVVQVGGAGSGQCPEILSNQQKSADEAARYAASLQGSAQGVVQGTVPPAQRGPSCPPAPIRRPVPAGWNAGMAHHNSSLLADANAVADDYDRDLQAALVASVTDHPGKWVKATHLTAGKPGENVSSLTADYLMHAMTRQP